MTPTSGLVVLDASTSTMEVAPRWPDRVVRIDLRALAALRAAEARLPQGIGLVLTRAYQPERPLHRIARRLGAWCFGVLQPSRWAERDAIFSHNGHANDGTHVDLALRVRGQRLRLLPLGVFTPRLWLLRIERLHAAPLGLVRAALAAEGFRVHPNPTEALQLHADWRG